MTRTGSDKPERRSRRVGHYPLCSGVYSGHTESVYWASPQTSVATEDQQGNSSERVSRSRRRLDLQTFDDGYVRALIEGDPEVERHFVHYFSDLISIKLRSRRLPQTQIDDMRQETFLRALSALRRNSLERADRLGAFVNSICNNVLLEHYRKRTFSSLDGETAPEPPDDRPTIETRLVTAQHKKVVEAVLSEMSRKDEQILRMVVLEERNKEEVCADLKVNREHLRVIVHRAKVRFREVLLKRFGDAYGEGWRTRGEG